MARHLKDSTPKLNDDAIETIAQAIRMGSYMESAAALAGISKDTLYRWLRQAESDDATDLTIKLSDAVRMALAQAEQRDLEVIDRAAQVGDWKAAAWRLERKFPTKWGSQSKVHVEHSGADGGPIEIQSISSEEMELRIGKLLQKRNQLIEV